MENIHIPKHISTTFFSGNAILLDSQKNSYYALNDSAADFWTFLQQTSSVETALKKVMELYEDSPDLIRKEMEELIRILLQARLLERE